MGELDEILEVVDEKKEIPVTPWFLELVCLVSLSID